ncbi:uncharacterized protein RCC_08763 [Ramularia collo-cygni]|uniref:Uncharacterized protein n=1 Tax=Ramularia collo-cygni TaxID=112498 RepID=A0A2D3V4Y8_9PEZI|nr:uncharacterized protein RCC_08763 [Ramularia collo-cygni]CZT23053.1 uncharacterized protein RCC_08763 [Ramularia collo-cygni]
MVRIDAVLQNAHSSYDSQATPTAKRISRVTAGSAAKASSSAATTSTSATISTAAAGYPKLTQPVNEEEALSQLALARAELAAGGDNAAALVEDLGQTIFGKEAFSIAKKPYVQFPTEAELRERRENAKFHILKSWAEFDEAGDAKHCGDLKHLGRVIYGFLEFDEALKEFNEE